jgi:hypothetical protein
MVGARDELPAGFHDGLSSVVTSPPPSPFFILRLRLSCRPSPKAAHPRRVSSQRHRSLFELLQAAPRRFAAAAVLNQSTAAASAARARRSVVVAGGIDTDSVVRLERRAPSPPRLMVVAASQQRGIGPARDARQSAPGPFFAPVWL